MRISNKYKEITDNINDAWLRGSDIVSFVSKMGTDLSDSEIPSDDLNKMRLENQINATSNLLTSHNIYYTPQLIKFVSYLQKYITNKYVSVDTFLSENNIKVKSTFADISEASGYPILPINISDVS